MMDAWIDLARGPLFRIALAVLVLGLAYRLGTMLSYVVAAWWRAGDRRLPTSDIVAATVGWLVPVRLLRSRPGYSIASFVFHLGVLLVAFFLAGHVALLAGILPTWWPVLAPGVADALTLAVVAALVVMLGGRLAVRSRRALTRSSDVAVLVLLLVVIGGGFLAAHPPLSPVDARAMLLLHVLAADLLLVMVPLSKIAHCVLYPLTQLVFQLGWHFPAATGRHVAIALGKENEPV
jgi:nitrate reductase gamma subunit